MKLKFSAGFLMICAALFLSTPAMAEFTNVVTFGDSISDNGTFGVTYPNETSDPGYTSTLPPWTNATTGYDQFGFKVFTDGAPWADQLAGQLDAEMFNAAIGGALTGYGNLAVPGSYGLRWQIAATGDLIKNSLSTPMATTLFTVWAGANDYNALSAGSTALDKQAAASLAVDNIIAALGDLQILGAQHILVPNLMLLGDGNFSITYNKELAAALEVFEETYDVAIYTVDMFSLYISLFGWAYDSTDPDDVAQAVADGLIWAADDYHPGPVTHDAMAEAALAAVENAVFAPAVPVPASMLLLVSGLIAFTGIRRRKAA